MDPTTYADLLRDLLSGDPVRVRAANRALYAAVVQCDSGDDGQQPVHADLLLAQVAG